MISDKSTILCVDDNETALQIRKLVLESAGYSVLVADDFARAIDLFSSCTVDAVLSDYLLNDSTGTELAAVMKKLRPEVPIAIISGAIEIPDGMEHADVFISKLDSPPEVLQKVSELLKRAWGKIQ